MASSISIYAEFLPNIRIVSLVATLPPLADASISATITHEGTTSSQVHFRDSRSTVSLTLPARVAVPQNYSLPVDLRRLEWRLPVAPDQAARGGVGNDSVVPWESKDLVAGGEVTCRTCGGILVGSGNVKQWKDLPAEGWADMMEFWHCHKPGEDHGHDHGEGKADEKALAGKGYGADSAIMAQRSVGFVDLTTFLLKEEDCEGVKISNKSNSSSTTSDSLNIFCKSCSSIVGYENHKAGGLTLFKWAVTVPTASHFIAPSPLQMDECISAILSATKARTGSSKSILLPIRGTEPTSSTEDIANKPSLLIQVLIPAMTYSSNMRTDRPVPAMRVLYRFVQPEERDRMLEDLNSDVQEVNLAWEEIAHLTAENGPLSQSTMLLPPGLREFIGCRVGMLRRWEAGS